MPNDTNIDTDTLIIIEILANKIIPAIEIIDTTFAKKDTLLLNENKLLTFLGK